MHITTFPRRKFLQAAACLAGGAASFKRTTRLCAAEAQPEPFFQTRGVVLGVRDMQTLNWPERAQLAGLTTIATHIFPHEIAAFAATDAGQAFLESCRTHHIQVEHELHAMNDLLPRTLFAKDPAMFRMDDAGRRVRDYNLCVHSPNALDVVCENAVKYAALLRPTTGRYFYWIDDGQPMCRCPKCRELSDSEQALLLENRILAALRKDDPRATLAHLAYHKTLTPPQKVKPSPGIFLEFAAIERWMKPIEPIPSDVLESLDANLEVFGRDGAQALEYWLDLSLFSRWKREKIQKLPWREESFRTDVAAYAARGVRHVTTFAVYLDGDYVRRFGDPPLAAYGTGLREWQLVAGKAVRKPAA